MFQLKIKHYLIVFSFFLVIALISLGNLEILPLRPGDFIFFLVLTLALALYRPGWAFLFFIALLPLENVVVSTESFPFSLRPYQIVAVFIVLSLLIRFLAKKLNFHLVKLRLLDILVILLGLSGFISLLASPGKALSLKLSLVVVSFVFIYFLTRTFVQDVSDLKRILPVFLVSAFWVDLYGLWQNWRFTHDLSSFEVMAGRPNATFPEADWLGIFLAFLIGGLYAIIFYLHTRETETYEDILKSKFLKYQKVGVWFLLFLSLALLVITVSRSAWIAVFLETLLFLWIVLTNLSFRVSSWNWKKLGQLSLGVVASFLLGLVLIFSLRLTRFELASRAGSSSTGLEKITIACVDDRNVPENISGLEELANYSCRHINLEDIASEEAAGRIIKEVYRPDPNFGIRSKIYATSLGEIRKHPLLGIGWGTIGSILGPDERGAALNASNVFLEIYLGSGLLGFLSFFVLWIFLLIKSLLTFKRAADFSEKTLALFIILAWTGLTLANLWNSGIMLGFLWVFLAIGIIREK